MARTITVQITLDDDVIKRAEAMLAKLDVDISRFVAWSFRNVAKEGPVQKAFVDEAAGDAETGRRDDVTGVATSAHSTEEAKKGSRLAAWNEFKQKHKGSIKTDFCWKTELAKARDEKYADYV